MVFVLDGVRPDLGGNMRHGDVHTWSPVLWRFLAERYSLRSMLDVGCGEGHAVAFFHGMGLYAHGIDGLLTNIERSVAPIALHDLLTGPYKMPVEFVWSCEVAEHIETDSVSHYLDTLTNGNIIAMTHALPGQGGHNHVNCQPPEYWISRLGERGYVVSEDNNIFRDVSGKEFAWTYFGRSGLVFVRSN